MPSRMKASPLFVAALGALAVLALALPCAAARRNPAKDLAGLTIGSIKIESFDVFNTDVYPESKIVYRMANALHRTTRESVVRRELLFSVGDRYDPNLVRETERNLRLLPIIRHASADAVVNSSGTVDVVVRTYDAWSLELIANFKRAGGSSEWKAGLTERNLLGTGKAVSAAYNQNGGSPSKSVDWRDTHFLGRSHLNQTLSAAAGPDTRHYAFGLDRPFFASITRHAYGLSGNWDEGKTSVYEGEATAGEVLRRGGEAAATWGVALATSTERTRRVRTGILGRHVEFSRAPWSPGALVPAREQLFFLQLGADWENLDFVTERRMQKFTHDEDYNLGLGVFPTLSWAPALRALGASQSQVLPGLLVRKGFDWEDRLLLLRASYGTTFVNQANSNRVAGADALFFYAGLLPRQTLALHAAYDHGWRLDPGSRLKLGESNGLRGYGLQQFSGERRFVLNAEDRVFIRDEFLRVVDIGAVVFYDAGWAWGSETKTQLTDLRHSVGVGLRLAPSRSGSNSPVRVDLARALNPNGTNSRWSLSILAGHAFGPD
jgi:hypothetical protein